MAPLLSVRGLTVTLPAAEGSVQAVRDLDLDLAKGQTLGIIGESGSGKSMAALALMGLLPEGAAAGGSVHFAGEDLLTADEARLCALRGNRLAMIFQEPMTALNPLHRIGDQIAEALILHKGLGARQARECAAELLERVGIPQPRERLEAWPHQLSGGQRQRVMIAMALACGPDLLIADEPTTALDVTIQRQILDLIRRLVAEDGMALLLISHDLGVIADTVERMLVMYGGRAVESGPVREVFAAQEHSSQELSSLAHPYTRGLFAALPRLQPGRPHPRPPLPAIPGSVPDLADLGSGCAFAPRCPLADPRCHAEKPPAIAMAPGHDALCWHAGEPSP